ncbi:hypothetical protein AVEN_66659-1 [Araneus ventricosus]|uniref:Uncharacterized protein n=1 Tax=Araneus ventricosus TaxID=182803 RepID=A0A4Y2T714_ARAVE|nr:hypothetical protein AVEN_66659-1 [Araneus ventricosus]
MKHEPAFSEIEKIIEKHFRTVSELSSSSNFDKTRPIVIKLKNVGNASNFPGESAVPLTDSTFWPLQSVLPTGDEIWKLVCSVTKAIHRFLCLAV